jgi:hypothetical protein
MSGTILGTILGTNSTMTGVVEANAAAPNLAATEKGRDRNRSPSCLPIRLLPIPFLPIRFSPIRFSANASESQPRLAGA